jgi:DNA-binding transcriptional MerR regulator
LRFNHKAPAATAVASSGGFSASDAASLAGIPYRTLARWAQRRIVTPSLSSPSGRGEPCRYDLRDVLLIALLHALREVGIPARRARALAARVGEVALCGPETDRLVVIATRQRVFFADKNDLPDLILREGRIDAVVDVARIWREVLGAVAKGETPYSSGCGFRHRDDSSQSPSP